MVQATKSRPAAKKTTAKRKAAPRLVPKKITGVGAIDARLLAVIDRLSDVLLEVNKMLARHHTPEHSRTQLLALPTLQLSKAEALLDKLRGEWVKGLAGAPAPVREGVDKVLAKLQLQLKRIPRGPQPPKPRKPAARRRPSPKKPG